MHRFSSSTLLLPHEGTRPTVMSRCDKKRNWKQECSLVAPRKPKTFIKPEQLLAQQEAQRYESNPPPNDFAFHTSVDYISHIMQAQALLTRGGRGWRVSHHPTHGMGRPIIHKRGIQGNTHTTEELISKFERMGLDLWKTLIAYCNAPS